MTDPNDKLCIDYRFLGSYGLDESVTEAYENAPSEQKAILNRIERLNYIEDNETFVREATDIQDTITATGFEFTHRTPDELREDKESAVGYIEGIAMQMVMGREEARSVMFGEDE